jgi:hypothetical protein
MFVRFGKLRAVLLVVLVAAAFLPVLAFAQGDAAGAIASAKQQMVACYDSARQAEAAGANISSLTVVLDGAGDLLSRSELAYSQGDLGGAQSLASQCSQKLGGFVSEADALRVAAEQQGSFNFWVYFVGSVVGTFVVIAAGYIVWRVVKRRYVPIEVEAEVQDDESSGD